MLSYLSPLTISVWIATLATQFWASGLLRKGRAAGFPAFRAYIYLCSLGCPATFVVAAVLPIRAYFVMYYILTVSVDILLFFVAFEMYCKVFGPRTALPKFVPERAAAMMAVSFIASAVLSLVLRATNGGSWTRWLVTTEQVLTAATFATFWILFIYSKTLRIAWPRRVAEIWIGFVLSLTVSIIAVFVRARAVAPIAIAADRTAMVTNLLAVGWWVAALNRKDETVEAFTQQEAEEMRRHHDRTITELSKSGILQ